MSESLENATQGATEPVETVPQPAIETPDTGTETTAAAPVEETAEEKARKGAQKRINELTREKYEERRQRQALEAEVTRLRAAPAPQAQTPAPEGFVPVAEVQKIAQTFQETAALNAACNDIAEYGASKFPDFDEATQNIASLKPGREFLEIIADLGKEEGARVYRDLGSDLATAERILALPPHRMAREIDKLAAKPAPVVPVSKAPPPVNPIGASRQAPDPLVFDPKNPAAWIAARNKRQYG